MLGAVQAALLGGSVQGGVPIDPTLKAWWIFDTGSGTTETDDTGNGWTLTLSNADQWVAGEPVGTIAKTDTVNSRGILGSASFVIGNAITLFMHVKILTGVQTFAALVSKADAGTASKYQFFTDTGAGNVIRFGYSTNTGQFQIASIPFTTRDSYVKIAFTWTATGGATPRRASVNGSTQTVSLVLGDFTPAKTTDNSAQLGVGRFSGGTPQYAKAYWREARIYEKNMTQDELNALTA